MLEVRGTGEHNDHSWLSQLTLQCFCRTISAKVSNLSFTFPAGKTQDMVDILNVQNFFSMEII